MKLEILTATAVTTLLLQCGGLSAKNKTSRNPDIIPVSIYGTDDRQDFFEADKFMRKFAESTVALFRAADLPLDETRQNYKIGGLTLKDKFNLDGSPRFGAQSAAAFCSGALVSDDTIITAGHCFKPHPAGAFCSRTKIAFGYAVTQEGQNPSALPAGEVYSCKEVLLQKFDENGADYALVRLDRKVKNHYPLAVSRQDVAQGAELAVIGYPSGLPVKIAKNGKVRRVDAEKGVFITDLDTFAGNSGSPVFNMKTMKIEGILARGDTDYLYASGDNSVADPQNPYLFTPGRPNVVGQDEGRGEDATLISQLQRYIAPTELERALDLIQAQKDRTSIHTAPVPAIYFPGSGQGVVQPAIYYPDPTPAPGEPISI